MSDSGSANNVHSSLPSPAHAARNVARICHVIGTTILLVLSTVEMHLGAWLIHDQEFETLTKDSFFLLVYIVFVSIWTMSCGMIFLTVPLGRPKWIMDGVKSVSAHFCWLALLWALWLTGASGISNAHNNANCGVCGGLFLQFLAPHDVLNSELFHAFQVFAWLNFAWTNVLLVVVFVFGVVRLREERRFITLHSPPPSPTLSPREDRRARLSGFSNHAGPSRIRGPSPGPSRIPEPGPSLTRPKKLRRKTSSLVALLPSTQSLGHDSSEDEGSDSWENLEPSAA